MSRPRLIIRRYGNTIDVVSDQNGPTPASAVQALAGVLSYEKRKMRQGAQRFNAEGVPVSGVLICPKLLYNIDANNHLGTNAGYLQRVHRALVSSGFEVGFLDLSPAPKDPRTYEIHKERITQHFSYRPRQEECVDQILRHRCGIIKAATGFGKMIILVMILLAFPYAKVDIVTRSTRLVKKLVKLIRGYMPCGQVGDGVCEPGGRITVYTADSLHRSPATADILLTDEGHQLAADRVAAQLVRYQHSRNFTFTASPEGRFDGTDIRLEGLFGQVIFELSYAEGVELGLIVPIVVNWSPVDIDSPCRGRHGVPHKRHGLWRNEARNSIVARRAQAHPGDQVLILVDTIEHAVHLLPFLDETWEILYSAGGMSADELDKYKGWGLLPADYKPLDSKRLDSLLDQLTDGTLRHAIAITSLAGTGIDMPSLNVVVRADAAASQIQAVQQPGRVSRTNASIGKEVGFVEEFADSFDHTFANRAVSRKRIYRKLGYEQIELPSDQETRHDVRS